MNRSRKWRLIVPLLTMAAGLLVSALIAQEEHSPYSILVLTVMVSAWYGGHAMGLAATIAGVLATALIPLDRQLWFALDAPGAVVQLMVFAGVGAVTSSLVDRQRRQRVALEDLRAQHARLAAVMNAIGLGHWYSDLPSQQMFWDEQCRQHLGLGPEDEITLEQFYACIHPDDREAAQQAAERAVFGHASLDVDFRVLHPDGSLHWVKALGRGFYDAAGRPTRFEGIAVDITRQKDAEATLAQASRMKDEFLATLSHELRTPLNAVLGWTRLLSSGNLPAHRVEHALAVIERNAQLQARLVEDLLDVSSIITGRLRLRVEPVDLSAIISGTLDAIRPGAEARNISLHLSIDDEARWITADADRLRQVAWNLLANAVKYTPDSGEVHVELSAVNARVVLEVRDSGMGIPAEFLSRVFDRFTQADPPEVGSLRGLGLGLSIVRELVEAHGGSVVASSPGRGHGATLKVTLPGRVAPPAHEDVPVPSAIPR
jgi:PAS domain S-box-containing protein